MQLRFIAMITATALLAGTAARSDIRYSTEFKPSAGASQDQGARRAPSVSITHYYKDMNERTETSIQFGQFTMTNVSITRCDKQQTMRVNKDLKIYTVEPVGAFSMMPTMGGPMQRPGAPEGQPGEGKLVSTFTVEDKGTDTVAGHDAHHSVVTIRQVSSGCLGDRDTTNRFEVWTIPGKIEVCPQKFAAARVLPNDRGCQITYEMKGDVAAMRTAMSGVIAKMVMYNGDQPSMVQEMKDYSEDPLDDSLFNPPADFKQVTAAEFTAAERKAMMDRFRAGANQGPPGGPPPAC